MFCRLVQCLVQMIQTNQCTIQKEVKKRQFCNILLRYNLARTTLQIGWGGRRTSGSSSTRPCRPSLFPCPRGKSRGESQWLSDGGDILYQKKHLNAVRKIMTHQLLLQITCGVRIFIYCKPAQNGITIMLLNKTGKSTTWNNIV